MIRIEQLPPPDTCIVAGSGRAFYDEFAAARAFAPLAHVMAVNFTAPFVVGPVQHVASLHATEVGAFRDVCQCLDWRYGYERPTTHSNKAAPGVDRVWPEYDNEEGRQGTSALFAVKIALALGYARVILVGVPLDSRGRFFDPPGLPATAHGNYDLKHLKAAWLRARDTLFAGRVSSLGGYTREILGSPLAKTEAA